MATYYVDDGGDNTTGASWATAYTSLSALDDAQTIAHGDIIYVGHDHVCQYVHAASRSITGPAASSAGVGVALISVTQGSSPPTYQASTTNQVDTSEGAYNLNMDGQWRCYGIRFKSGSSMQYGCSSGVQYFEECTFALPANGSISGATSGLVATFVNCTLDLTADGTTNRSSTVIALTAQHIARFIGLAFVNPAYRTTYISSAANVTAEFIGCDFSGFTNASTPEIMRANQSSWGSFTNCKFPSTTDYGTVTSGQSHQTMYTNCGTSDDPTELYFRTGLGDVLSSTAIYRSTGASVLGTATAWLVTTTSSAVKHIPMKTPWMYSSVATTGSKTFSVYITNDTADFNDDEVWLEVEYKATASSPVWSRVNDRATITATGSAQTDDTTSTWNGTGPSFTYKQKLSVTVTVNQAGEYRARVCAGKTSVASSSYFYVDPKVVVT